jgi:cellulose synthase/poly-beta-1,6-N-acetylglucosamine synthase-like glycosyltransferase
MAFRYGAEPQNVVLQIGGKLARVVKWLRWLDEASGGRMIAIVYGVVCAAMLVLMAFLYGYSFHALWISRRKAPAFDGKEWPRAALIIPCKGLDPQLKENLRRHFQHDYPDYRLIFAVADAGDPACRVIRELLGEETSRPASLVIAPPLSDCVEKISNQLAALRSLPADVEVIVCSDSDGLPRDAAWLFALVAGLQRGTLVSGFRWYVPPRPALTGSLQSAFDASWCLLHALGKTTWGGAMAFRRDTFERLSFADHLRVAITDDLALQVCTQRAGERTGFVPGGMVLSEPAEKFGDFFRWAVRQSQLVRLVTPWLWLMGFAAANVYAVFFLLSAVLLCVPEVHLGRVLPASALAVALLYYLGRGLMTYWLARSLFPAHPERTASLRWIYFWANPLADLLAPVVAYASLFARTVRWRGVRYRVHGGRVVRV